MNDEMDVLMSVPDGGVRPLSRWLRATATGLAVLLAGCDRPAAPPAMAHPVGVVTLRAQPLAVSVTLPGRVTALRTAEVRPQVSGILLTRRFREGAGVQAGEPLWQIDPAPYQAAVNRAQGELARSQSAAAQAHRTATRYRALLGTQYVSPQEVDQADAQAQQADAQVLVDRASLRRAQIDLGYTRVRAPLTGITGRAFYTEGALVTDGQAQPLLRIQQLDPVYVDITEDSDAWLSLQRELHNGTLTAPAGPVPVTVSAGDGAAPVRCSLLFTDVTVDTGTGSLALRATCPNPHQRLLPGMFVRAVLSPGVRGHALMVPREAVNRTPGGQATVMVVENNTAQVRQVHVADTGGQQWRVTDGLRAGEQVVVTGQLLLRPGMAVKVTDVTPVVQDTASRDAGRPADDAAGALPAPASAPQEAPDA
ncbi:efflux RND transporter periplasmic adaptor subunit [Enterobacter cloacae]|nr:efflux RND transporter periplasmic adaptor subunit [Enterobacter cloacae]